MGIRLALGSTPARLRARLVCRTLVIAGIGAVVGIAGASAAVPQLQHLIKGAEQQPTLMLAVAVCSTLVVACAATWLATHRLARLDVTEVLRAEG
jgi:ABC-type lipoprotein release transport system permease subunit